MIKLVDILLNEDLPKGKWVDLDNKKTKEYIKRATQNFADKIKLNCDNLSAGNYYCKF